MSEEPPERPEDLSPIGSLPGEDPQQTPEESEAEFRQNSKADKLKGFIDLDELEGLSRDEKVQLVQIIAERFVWGHLNGMNGTVGYSETLRPEIKNREIVAGYRRVANDLYGHGVKHLLPYQIKDESLQFLKHVGTTNQDGETEYFESIIRPPKVEPNPRNPYLQKEAFVYHDARLLDRLIKELYIDPSKKVVGFSKN